MGQYTGRLVTSLVMFLVALICLVLGYTLGGWLVDGYSSSSYTSYFPYSYGWSPNQYSSSGSSITKALVYTDAMTGTLLASISLTSLCLLLSIIMVVADIFFRVTQGMAVIPRITTGLAVLAGVLADVTCALYLVRLYAIENYPGIPKYPFFIVAFTGISLMVTGCVNNGAKQTTNVGTSGNAVRSVAGASASGQAQGPIQTLSAYNLYPYGGTSSAAGMMSASQFQGGVPPGYQQPHTMLNAPPYTGVSPNPSLATPQGAQVEGKQAVD